MDILYLDKDIVVAVKPPLVPTQPDPSCDEDFLSMLGRELRCRGEDETLFVVHRLDRVVGGILAFARTKGSAAKLSDALREGRLKKEYLAVLDGETPPSGILEDFLIKDHMTSRAHSVPSTRRGSKYARLSYETLSVTTEGTHPRTLIKVLLDTGRFHQIRIQFSVRKAPLLGDGKYGSKNNKCAVSLFAYRLTFPTKSGDKTVTCLPDFEKYPWSLFSKEVYPR